LKFQILIADVIKAEKDAFSEKLSRQNHYLKIAEIFI